MKHLFTLLTVLALFGFSTASNSLVSQKSKMQLLLEKMTPNERVEVLTKLLEGKGSCEYKGIKLYGKVKFVSSFPDIKIKYVDSFPDIKVKFVSSFADDCGEWQQVSSFPDFKVKIVDSFPDIKVKVVESFPGM